MMRAGRIRTRRTRRSTTSSLFYDAHTNAASAFTLFLDRKPARAHTYTAPPPHPHPHSVNLQEGTNRRLHPYYVTYTTRPSKQTHLDGRAKGHAQTTGRARDHGFWGLLLRVSVVVWVCMLQEEKRHVEEMKKLGWFIACALMDQLRARPRLELALLRFLKHK